MRYFLLICLLSGYFSAFAQKASIQILPIKSQANKPWTSLDLNKSEGDFQFAIVTDRTGGHRPGVFMDAVNKLNLLQPEFVLSVGDLIEGYTENQTELKRQWDEFDAFVNKLEMPFFYVPGNHDITNQVMEDVWKDRLGDTYYAFVYNEVLFLCLNSEDQKRGAGRGTVSDEQYEWVRKTLSEHTNVKHTLVFMHQPLWTQEKTERWKDVEALLANRRHHVFTGHYHRYTKYERNNGKYFVLATTGGGSSLRGPAFGEFDHVVWVTMKESGPIVANLLLEGIWDENVLTETLRAGIDKIQDKSPVSFELVYSDADLSKGKDFEMKLTNDEDVPMKVRLEPGISFDQALFCAKNEVEVAPNSVEKINLHLIPKNMGHNDFRPVKFTTHISFLDESAADVEMAFTYKIKPVMKNSLAPAPKNVSIDADLREWKDLDHFIPTHGDEGISARFDIAYDDQMLYVAARVEDDKIFSFGAGSPWTQDYIGLCMNAEKEDVSAMSVGRSWYRDEMYFLQTPQIGDKETRIWPNEKLPEGSQYACKVDGEGYNMEWAIPIAYIEALQGKDWKNFRFNIMVGDKDSETEDPKMYFWEPNWRGDDNYLGSGMFFRD